MDGEAKVGEHHEYCNPRTKIDADVIQADRRCRLASSSGKKAHEAYMETFKNLKDAKLDVHYQPYIYNNNCVKH